jgi:methionyl-tRNA formyltransferase
MRVALIGAVETTAATLEELCRRGSRPVAVIGLPLELAARHSDFVDLEVLASIHGVPFHQVDNVNKPEALALIAGLDLDWLVVVGWSQICGQELLALPRQGSIGYHPAALPRMRGRAVIAWTILLGLEETAGSLFLMAPTVDSGALIAQAGFALDPRETVSSLIAKHVEALRRMWATILPLGAAASLTGRVQDEADASYCAKRVASDGEIDWTAPATAIDRLVRAVSAPYPGAFSHYRGRRLIIHGSRPWAGPTHYGLPGQVLERRDDGLLIACGDYSALWVEAYSWADGVDSKGPPVGRRLTDGPVT